MKWRIPTFLFWNVEVQLIATAICLTGLWRDSWQYRAALELGGAAWGSLAVWLYYRYQNEPGPERPKR